MRKVLSIVIICIVSICFGQKHTFVYNLKYKKNTEKNYFSENLYFLDINNKKSAFRSELDRKSDSSIARKGLGYGRPVTYNHQFYVHKDLQAQTVSRVILAPFTSQINYSIRIDEKIDWKIKEEKMKIGEYECQKAELNYGGRLWTAWFTSEIPISDGPYIFNGLPGLIVKLFDKDLDYQFDLVRVKQLVWDDLLEIRRFKSITWDEFDKLQKVFYEQPLLEIKSSNMPIAKDDGSGKVVKLFGSEMKPIEDQIKKQIREGNNPIEINRKIDYK